MRTLEDVIEVPSRLRKSRCAAKQLTSGAEARTHFSAT